MRAIVPFGLLALLAPLILAGCDTPSPESYTRSARATSTRPVEQLSIGKNSVGEDCTQQAESGQSADVFCGSWQQPSARVRAGGPGTAVQLPQLATSGTWRAAIDSRFRCEPPMATTILGSNPAELMHCVRL